jgi:cellulose synthase/poly-beta-1,6-N-acetylglucosamine synthase-like glycosyltransferase
VAGFVAVGLGLTLLLFFLTLLGPILVTHAATMFNVGIDTTALTLFFFAFCTLYNTTMLSVVAVHDRRRLKDEKEAADHRFSIMVPARNEELVIEKTLRKILSLDYPKQLFEVLLINDGSTDHMVEIAERLRNEFHNLDILSIPLAESGRGKSQALNTGYTYLLRRHGHPQDNWIIGVFDADGQPQADMLKKASYQFRTQKVGALQALVRMSNRHQFFLAMLQDVEFSTFARVSQFVRSIFKGAVALGGNGQFIRTSTLESVTLANGDWWRRDALTEDLDIGVRLLLAGWENEFLVTTTVSQQAVDSFGALYKQRTRWAWGTLQALQIYVLSGAIFRSKLQLIKKIDIVYYMSFIVVPPVMLFCWIISLLGLAAVISTYNPFPSYFMITNGVSFFPLIAYGLLRTRKEDRSLGESSRFYSIPFFIPIMIMTTAYTYHWVPCTIRAILHALAGDKPRWVKTQRVAEKEMLGPPSIVTRT